MQNIFEDWTPDRVLALMLLLGLNRQQMADILDIANVSTVGRILNGQTRLTAKRIVQLNVLNNAAQILRAQAIREKDLQSVSSTS